MDTKIIDNLLSEKEISIFNNITKDLEAPKDEYGNFIFDDQDSYISVSKYLGRIQFNINNISDLFPVKNLELADKSLTIRLTKLANSISGLDLTLSSITYVEYSSRYGTPSLPPHYDGDNNDLIVNYQFDSNTRWDIGVNFETYEIKNNSALVFNPNKTAHWRPNKIFNDGDFVKMIFFRFAKKENPTDYSDLQKFWPNDEVFKNICEFRNSLS
ncbi:MAG: hypothetical protein ACK5P0_01425 [bacterium]|jgi:hypothetical protein